MRNDFLVPLVTAPDGRTFRDPVRLVPIPGVVRIGNHVCELGSPTAVPNRRRKSP